MYSHAPSQHAGNPITTKAIGYHSFPAALLQLAMAAAVPAMVAPPPDPMTQAQEVDLNA